MWPDPTQPVPVSDLLTIGVPERDLMVLRRFFESRRYRLFDVTTLDAARQLLQVQRLRAIFVDQDVSGIDGFEALRLLRRSLAIKEVPIFLFAARH